MGGDKQVGKGQGVGDIQVWGGGVSSKVPAPPPPHRPCLLSLGSSSSLPHANIHQATAAIPHLTPVQHPSPHLVQQLQQLLAHEECPHARRPSKHLHRRMNRAQGGRSWSRVVDILRIILRGDLPHKACHTTHVPFNTGTGPPLYCKGVATCGVRRHLALLHTVVPHQHDFHTSPCRTRRP